MSKNSKYAERQKEKRRAEAQVIMVWSIQLAMDIMTSVLNDPKVMKSGAMGAKRLKRVQDAFVERFPEYSAALSKHPEADYLRYSIDREQRRIFGPDALTWEQRYDGWDEKE